MSSWPVGPGEPLHRRSACAGKRKHCITSAVLNSQTLPFILLIFDPLAPLNLLQVHQIQRAARGVEP